MKKLYVLGPLAALLLGLVACGPDTSGDGKKKDAETAAPDASGPPVFVNDHHAGRLHHRVEGDDACVETCLDDNTTGVADLVAMLECSDTNCALECE